MIIIKKYSLINICQCLSVCPSQMFANVNVSHLKDLGVVELCSRIPSRTPMINLWRCIVYEGARLSTIAIGLARVKFSKLHQMAYWHLGTLIWVKFFFTTIVTQICFFFQNCSKLFIRPSGGLFRPRKILEIYFAGISLINFGIVMIQKSVRECS